MRSFRDPVTGVLKAWGYAESNGGDLIMEEPDDFNLEPGKWRWVNDEWAEYKPAIIPQEVTMQQARRALFRAGKLALIAPAIAAMPSPQKDDAQIKWEYSATVKRNDSLTVAMGVAIGLTSEQMDQLFIDAATL